MGLFLNSRAPYETYSKLVRSPYFVDKSLLLTELVPAFDSINCYYCVTRPRRFGKTVMANMIGAFFGKTDKKDRITVKGQKNTDAEWKYWKAAGFDCISQIICL